MRKMRPATHHHQEQINESFSMEIHDDNSFVNLHKIDIKKSGHSQR